MAATRLPLACPISAADFGSGDAHRRIETVAMLPAPSRPGSACAGTWDAGR
jgi:hypothetical protein